MSIVGDKPESGVRIVLERPRYGGPPWIYEGTAELPETRYPIRVVISDAGAVDVHAADAGTEGSGNPLPDDLASRIRLLVRTVFRQAHADGEPPARRIVRWRPDSPQGNSPA